MVGTPSINLPADTSILMVQVSGAPTSPLVNGTSDQDRQKKRPRLQRKVSDTFLIT